MGYSPIIDGLRKIAQEGEGATNDFLINKWSNQAASFLNVALSTADASEFWRLKSVDLWEQHAMRLGHIQGLAAKLGAQLEQIETSQELYLSLPALAAGKKVFVVHGHNNEVKETVARFLEKLLLEPIILHEQPNSGRTIIEKFETYSGDIAFSVVLLTPDDIGSVNGQNSNLQPRARQNVILELGYFLGKLGRNRVCALHKGGIELPSDIQGVLYVAMDDAGAWRTQLAQELVEAKLPINLEGLVGG